MAQELGVWYWAADTMDDWLPLGQNQAYFGTGWGLYFTWTTFQVHEWISVIIVVLLETSWQIVHGMVPDTTNAYLGGKGFSYIRLVYGIGGMTLALLFDLMIPPHIRPFGADDPCEDYEEDSDDWKECIAAAEQLEEANEF